MAAKLTDKQHTQIEEPRPPGMPTDAELEAAGAVIGSVDIDIRNIFDENDPAREPGLYRLADRLHVRTKPATIRAQLLFKSGDRYSARNLAETERNLRTLVFIYDAHVVPVRFADGKVDVRVITSDVWTFDPNVSFGRTGGTNSTSANLQEENFLGWGKQLEVGHTSNVDRTSKIAAYADPNVFGSHWTAGLAYVDSSDGSQRLAALVAAFLFPRYALERDAGRAKLRSHGFPLFPRQHRGSVQRQREHLSDRRRTLQRARRRLDQAPPVRHALRSQRIPAHPDRRLCRPSRAAPRTLSYPFVGFDILQDKYGKAGR